MYHILQRVMIFFIGLCLLFSVIILLPRPIWAAPAVWELSDADTKITLFGTIHILKPKTDWQTPLLIRRLSAADAIILELDSKQQAAAGPLMASAGKLPSGVHLRQIIGNGLYGDVRRQSKIIGLPLGTFDTAQPWFAALSLNVLTLIQAGYNPAVGADAVIMDFARNNNITLLGLESARFQSGIFSNFSPEQQKQFLTITLQDLSTATSDFHQMESAWLAGDTVGLNALINKGLAHMPSLAEPLLYQRNQRWADVIEQMLDKPGSFFVAVGAAHLIGKKSLHEYLNERGITVTRIRD